MLNEFFTDKPLSADKYIYHTIPDYHRVVLEGGFLNHPTAESTTQKAKGIFFLQENEKKIREHFPDWRIPKHLCFQAGTVFNDFCFDYPIFARPCPTVPRHGFVDSVICNNGAELTAVSEETYNTESAAELLVTKPVDSLYNVIINGGVITFAPGNDGATSGKGCNYFYISDDPIAKITGLDSHNIIAPDEVPFYEFVLDRDDLGSPVRLVQVRSAPHTPRVKDFVPDPVKVLTILKAEGDLLEWESKLKVVDPKTTIIDHTSGSLSSHYAIHAIINRIPIFTSYLPELGSMIEPTVENTEIDEDDRDKFFKAFVSGFSSTPEIIKNLKFRPGKEIHLKMKDILILALATLHNFSGLALSKDYEILGIVLGMFCRVAFSVSAGEARYGFNNSNGKFKEFFDKLPHQSGRQPCYDFVMNNDTKWCIDNVPTIYYIFSQLAWGSSYGGKKWASCTLSTINLFNACVNREITKVVELFNAVINEEHNGGKYLNKVIDIESFDEAANNPGSFTLNYLHTIVDLLHTGWSASVGVEQPIALFKPIVVETPEIISIDLVKEAHKTIFLKSSDGGGLFKTLTFFKNEVAHEIPLPEPISDNSPFCCIQCNPPKLVSIYSAPSWWTLKDGTKVISKSKLTRLIKSYDKSGIVNNVLKDILDNPNDESLGCSSEIENQSEIAGVKLSSESKLILDELPSTNQELKDVISSINQDLKNVMGYKMKLSDINFNLQDYTSGFKDLYPKSYSKDSSKVINSIKASIKKNKGK